MFKVSRLTDYGVVLLRYLASSGSADLLSARDLSTKSGLPLPTVSKLLKLMAQHKLINAKRGSLGGYELAADLKAVSLFRLIEIFEGSPGLTACLSEQDHGCQIDSSCPQRSAWFVVHQKIAEVLHGTSLNELIGSPMATTTLIRGKHGS